MRGQVKIKQTKLAARRRRKAFYYSLYFVFALGIIVSGLSFVSQLEVISIDKVVVEGNLRMIPATIENLVEEKIAGNYGYLFSKRNTFLYPKQEIVKSVLSLPSIKRADVSRRGLKVLVVSIEERGEIAKWCQDAHCYSVDDNGYIFALENSVCGSGVCMKTTNSSAPSYTYTGKIEGDPLGQTFLPVEDFKKIQFFMKQIDGLSVRPRSVDLSQSGYMTISLEDGGRLIINTFDDLTTILENIATIISDKTIAPDFTAFLKNLDYIKLDSGNKVVYKMRS
jgi:hypothetical protein